MTKNQNKAAWILPFTWFSRIRMARNAVFSLTQIVASTIALFWIYRRCAMSVGLPALGAWSVTTGLVSLLAVVDLGMTDVMVREVARLRVEKDWAGMRRAIWTCSLYVGMAIPIIGLVTFPVFHFYLGRVLNNEARLVIDVLILNSVVILAANTVFVGLLGAIEGFERYSFRLIVTVSGSSSLITASYFLIPRFGTVAISMCFMIQSIVNLLVAAYMLKTLVPDGGQTRSGFSLVELRRMSKLGVPIRLGSLVNLTYEPITRLLIVKFGGAGSAGTYEAAVRCGIQAKALIAGCIQVVLPRFSALAVKNVDAFKALLQFAYKVTGLLVIGVLPVILLATPIISFALLGRFDEKFQLFAEILSVGWLVNVLAVPTSFANLADGRLFWTWFANVCAAIINPAVGLVLGRAFGSTGVVIATGCALVSMSFITLIARRLTARDKIPHPGLSSAALVATAIVLVAVRLLVSEHYKQTLTILAASTLLSITFAAIWLVVAFKTVKHMLQEAGVG